MKATFKISLITLQELIQISDGDIYFKLCNDEIRFLDYQQGRRLIGRLKTVENYNLPQEIMGLPNLDAKRTFSIHKSWLYYFSRRVIGDKIHVEVDETHIKLVDVDNELRSARYRLRGISNMMSYTDTDGSIFRPIYDRLMDFIIKDDIILTQFMIDTGNYIILKAGDRKYKNTKVPFNEARWGFKRNGDIMDMLERRYQIGGYISDDIWHYTVTQTENAPGNTLADKYEIYYDNTNINKYVDISGTENIIIAVNDKGQCAVFLVHNNEYINTTSALRPKIPEHIHELGV